MSKNGLKNPYRMAWLLVFFDLPVDTKNNRRLATNFRQKLLRDGYIMLQFSVYARPCPTREQAETHARRLKKMISAEGEVRVLTVTDAQWGRMDVYFGKKQAKPEKRPEQLLLF